MLQVRLLQFGPPSVAVRCERVPGLDAPSPWDAIVEVDAFPINPADLASLSGQYGIRPNPPSAIGMEAAGRIVALGESVRDFAVGDRVMVMATETWSQRLRLPANVLYKVPADADPLQVAMMKVNPATAFLLLTTIVDLQPGSWIIQNAPLSNVGHAVIQIARAKRIRTVNVVQRSEQIDQVKELGAEVVLQDGTDLAAQVRSAVGRFNIKLALDAVGGQATQSLATCLTSGGTVVTYGMLSGQPCEIEPHQLIFNGIRVQGFWLSKLINRMSQQRRVELYDQITDLVMSSTVVGKIDSCFGIDQIATAIRQAEQRGRNGKVMVLPNGPVETKSTGPNTTGRSNPPTA